MTVLSAQTIRRLRLLSPLREAFRDSLGNSGGLGPCGYDITLFDAVNLNPYGFALVGAAEHFTMPDNVVGRVCDKSSLARRAVAVQNTVIEPGWSGFLTLEVTNHGAGILVMPPGAAIAQVIFEFLDEPTELPYRGKYPNQQQGPQGPREAPEERHGSLRDQLRDYYCEICCGPCLRRPRHGEFNI
jgi:dCTP deaminase